MALNLNTHQISGVYALDQWFQVKPGSFFLDAYSLREWDADPGEVINQWTTSFTDYELGALYRDREPRHMSTPYGPNSAGRFQTPTGSVGCCFIDANTGERVSFSIMEVKAFREDTSAPTVTGS
jgi:hypothetical protein